MTSEISDITPGLQCCLLCGRTLTDRALHDRLEEPIINAIRLEHHEWAGANGACAPCVSAYRGLLAGRMTRAERLRVEAREGRWWWRVSRFLNRGTADDQAARNIYGGIYR